MQACTLISCRRAFFFVNELTLTAEKGWKVLCLIPSVLLCAHSQRPTGDGEGIFLYSDPLYPLHVFILLPSIFFTKQSRTTARKPFASLKNGLEVVLDVAQPWESSANLLGSDTVAVNRRDSVAFSRSYRVRLG